MTVLEYVNKEFATKLRRLGQIRDPTKIAEPALRTAMWAGSIFATIPGFLSRESAVTQIVDNLRLDSSELETMTETLGIGWDTGEAQPVSVDRLTARAETAWRESLSLDAQGRVLAAVPNLITIMRNDPQWAGALGYDTLLKKVVLTGKLPLELDVSAFDSVTDPEDSARVRSHIDTAPGFVLPPVISHPAAFDLMSVWFRDAWDITINSNDFLGRAAVTAAMFNRSNRLAEWVKSQKWDGTLRLVTADGKGPSELALKFTKDRDYAERVVTPFLRLFILSLAARILQPGCKVDTMLIIEGEQGTRKSTSMRALMPHRLYYSDSPINLDNKDGMQNGMGLALLELSEIDKLLYRKNAADLKSWCRSDWDRLRLPYAAQVGIYPRTFVAYGTVNAKGAWLNDYGEQRAYMPIRVDQIIDTDWIAEFRGQLFAEALLLIDAGWTHIPSAEEHRLIIEEMNTRLVPSATAELVKEELIRYGLTFVRQHDIVTVLLGVEKERVDAGVSRGVTDAMKSLGWSQDRGYLSSGERATGWWAPSAWPVPPSGWNSEATPRKGVFARPVATLSGETRDNVVAMLQKEGRRR